MSSADAGGCRLATLSQAAQPRALRVLIGDALVGMLAQTPEGTCAFEYDRRWLAEGFSISPLSLPLEPRVFTPPYLPFEGLWGVFNDSLPDGWGRLLVDRMLRAQGLDPGAVTPLTRLAIVGESGMGALRYEPAVMFEGETGDTRDTRDLDALSREATRILSAEYSDSPGGLDELFELGGSSGGARPKILTQIDGQSWIIKFPAAIDPPEAGRREYDYALAARDCGILMPEVRLFASQRCSGYFGVRRFDREPDKTGGERRVPMASASALLETSHRIPALDYRTLMHLTLELCRDFQELERLYRLMCFNVFAHNQDDHSKNFAFLYREEEGAWTLSPAFDLTRCTGLRGEHATTVNGKGRDITVDDAVALATELGLAPARARQIAEEIRERTARL